jgi:Uncharacterised ACR, YkgG family COG1556.
MIISESKRGQLENAELLTLKKVFEKNNFECYLAKNKEDAYRIFTLDIFPNISADVISYADSQTMMATGVLDFCREQASVFIDTFDPKLSFRDQIYNRKKALLADLFLTGTNAFTAKGQLVNLDMVGNRTAALTFGPRNVVLFIGVNKQTPDLDSAMERVQKYAAPRNATRHQGFNTPCVKTGECHDCNSPQRLCNTWTITEKSFPKGRIKIILINQELGI